MVIDAETRKLFDDVDSVLAGLEEADSELSWQLAEGRNVSSAQKALDKATNFYKEKTGYIERVKNGVKTATGQDRRELDLRLFSFIKDLISSEESVAPAKENAKKSYGALKIDSVGKELKIKDLDKTIKTSANRDERAEAWHQKSVIAEKHYDTYVAYITSLNQATRKLWNDIVGDGKVGTYMDLSFIAADIDKTVILDAVETVKDRLAGISAEMRKELADAIGVDILMPYDKEVARQKRFLAGDEYFPRDGSRRALKSALKDMGFDGETFKLSELGSFIDARTHKKRIAGAACFSFNRLKPERKRIMLNPLPGANMYRRLLHETGHLLHSHYMSKNNKEFVYATDADCFCEAMASVLEEVMFEEKWLKENTKLRKSENIEKFMELKRANLAELRDAYVMYTKFEASVYDKVGSANLNELYCNIQKELGNIPNDVDTKSIWLATPHFTTHPTYLPNYFVAKMIAATIKDHLVNEYGSILTPNTSKFLIENCYTGQKRPWQERIYEATGKKISVDGLLK